jgi:hypothetical protein
MMNHIDNNNAGTITRFMNNSIDNQDFSLGRRPFLKNLNVEYDRKGIIEINDNTKIIDH